MFPDICSKIGIFISLNEIFDTETNSIHIYNDLLFRIHFNLTDIIKCI